MKLGQLRRDDDCHWYLVPLDEVDDFDQMSAEMEGVEYMDKPNLFDEFNNRFGDYRVDGYADFDVLMPATESGNTPIEEALTAVQPLIESYRELAVQRERRAVELASENAKLQQDNELLTSLLKALGDEAVAEYRRLYEAGELTGPDNQSEVRG